MNGPSITVLRHLDDIDNLRDSGRDGGLVPGQEDSARVIAEELLERASHEGQLAIFFVSSDRLRTKQTVALIADAISVLAHGKIRIRHAVLPDLAAMYQGEFVLPEDYAPGDFYEPLQSATKAWVKETSGECANMLYRFGDPVLLADGSWRHPELARHFDAYGENSQECLLRFYRLALAACKDVRSLQRRTRIVVVTHAQLYQIFTSLSTVALRIRSGELAFASAGKLPAYCWQLYRERWKLNGGDRPNFPALHVPVNSLSGGGLARVLGDEIGFLQSIGVTKDHSDDPSNGIRPPSDHA